MGWITEHLLGGASKANNAEANPDIDAQRKQRDQFSQTLAGLQPGQAPVMNPANIDLRQQDQFRQGQRALVTNLQQAAAGDSSSVAQLAGQRQVAQNIANQIATASAARGPNRAMAERTAANNAAQLNAGAGAQAAQLQAQEVATARGQLGGALDAARGTDVSLATNQAGLNQQASSNNQKSTIDTRGQDITQQNNVANQSITSAKNASDAELKKLEVDQKNYDTSSKEAAGKASSLSAVLSPFSDRNLKTDIKPEPKSQLIAFLQSVNPSTYRYKDGGKMDGEAPGKRHGVIAQDLEKSDVGRTLVLDTPKGKMIDAPQAVGTMLAAMSMINDRLEAVEKKKRK